MANCMDWKWSAAQYQGNSWTQATVDLSNYSVTKLRFSGSRGSVIDLILLLMILWFLTKILVPTLGQQMQ